jgi:UTP:GlnB (protein PII) uridylyltransferase
MCACQKVAQNTSVQSAGAFDTPRELLQALREDFGCLSQTAELVGLRSANSLHKSTVDIHTLEVVENLKALREFASLPPECQETVELAAYLHDIGKGPKARWADSDGLQKVDPDHPVRAMPMLVEIFTGRVRTVEQKDVDQILKLVCFHDLVGEVLGKGRDEQQIVEVAGSKVEIDMLFALGRADATSLVELWWDEERASALHDRCWRAVQARARVPVEL